MVTIDDIRWLASRQARQFWIEISELPVADTALVLKRARSLFLPSQASLMMAQLELLATAKRKVSEPWRWHWTKQLLEQASDEITAMETAQDFPAEAHVDDICCGAGADAIALAKRNLNLKVVAYDRCPIACELVRQNAASHSCLIQVVETSAENIQIDASTYINIDPDRRSEGRRVTNLDSLSPSSDVIQSLVAKARGFSLKLSPGLRVEWNSGLPLAPEAIRYLSKDGAVKQQRWYWGLDRWPKDSIVVSTHSKSSEYHWSHEIFDRKQAAENAREILVDRCMPYVADYDPAIRAAELGAAFAKKHQWSLLDSSSGYLTANQPVQHPMVRWFRLLHELPLDRKQIKSFAKTLDTKTWELKSRGVDLDLDEVRKMLPTSSKSNEARTILFTRIGGRHRALICVAA